MKWMVVLGFVVVSMVSCTKGSSRATSNKPLVFKKVPFESGISYETGEIADINTAAVVDGEVITWKQLIFRANALQSVETRWHESVIGYVYTQAMEMVAQKKLPAGTATIDFYFQKPKEELMKILAKLQITPRDEITVNFKGLVERGVVAKIGDKVFTEEKLQSTNLMNAKLFKSLFTQRMIRLNNLTINRYLLKASKKQNISIQEYIKKNIFSQVPDVTSEMITEFAKEKGIPIAELNKKMKVRLEEIVRQEINNSAIEAHVIKNLVKSSVKVAFDAPQLNIQAPTLSEAVPHWGRKKGPSMLFIGHWACDNCSSPLELFLESKKKFGESVKGWFLYSFPDRDREMRMSAEAGMCVYHQNPEFLWAFMDAFLKKGEKNNSEEAINKAVRSTKADYDHFRKCFLAREHKQAVESHLSYVKNMGIHSAPVVVIEGRVFEVPFDNSEVMRTLASFSTEGEAVRSSFFIRVVQFFKDLFS